MALRKYISLLLLLAVFSGCVPPKAQSRSKIGRARTADSGSHTAWDSTGTKGTEWNKTWGEVTSSASSQSWSQELLNFTSPSLSGLAEDQQLGFVSPQSGQNTGVRFYGNAITTGTTGGYTRSFDQASMLIHVEFYDDKSTNQSAAPVVVEISPDINGFVGAGGTLSGSQVNLYFQDQYGTVRLSGYVNGQTFSGNFGYCTGDQSYCSNTNNTRLLGQFSVDACGFFQCN